MKKGLFITVIILTGICTSALAQNKVVVIPLNSNKAAGADGQVQYNDGGNTGGAEIYYDKATGNVGIGTSAPTAKTQITSGNTPGVRLDQDNSQDATPQVWDIGGNDLHFFVRDVTSGNFIPFRIVPGAPDNAIYVGSDGNIGIGTSSPAAEMQITSGDTPTISLDQDNSVDFDPQVWEINGNEVYFSIRDATTQTAPFRITPGAPTGSLEITSTGDVGIGTGLPNSKLQVNGYIQLAVTSGAPPAADCDQVSERGRMTVDSANGLLYVCVNSGWVAK